MSEGPGDKERDHSLPYSDSTMSLTLWDTKQTIKSHNRTLLVFPHFGLSGQGPRTFFIYQLMPSYVFTPRVLTLLIPLCSPPLSTNQFTTPNNHFLSITTIKCVWGGNQEKHRVSKEEFTS